MTLNFRDRILQATVDRLAPLAIVNGGFLQAIVTIGQPIKGDNEMATALAVLLGRSPAVLISLGMEKFESAQCGGNARRWKATIPVCVYIVSANHRSFEAGRMSPDAPAHLVPRNDPGFNAIAEAVEVLLAGFSPIETGHLKPLRHEHLFTDADGTIREYTFELTVDRQLASVDDARNLPFIREIAATFSTVGINPPEVVETFTKSEP